MIEALGLTKIYPDGTRALQSVSIKVQAGEFVAIIGRSGSGKTTLLRLFNGTIFPSDGKLKVLGEDVSRLSSQSLRLLRRQIGFIFQQFNLVKNLTAFQNVILGRLGYMGTLAAFCGWFSSANRNIANQYLSEVGLGTRSHVRVDKLSGGEQQRVAVARALVQDPKIILADEPMASLDPRLSEVVLTALTSFNEKKKITIIFNIHVVEMAKKYAKRIIGLKAGKVVYDGPPSELTDEILKKIYD